MFPTWLWSTTEASKKTRTKPNQTSWVQNSTRPSEHAQIWNIQEVTSESLHNGMTMYKNMHLVSGAPLWLDEKYSLIHSSQNEMDCSVQRMFPAPDFSEFFVFEMFELSHSGPRPTLKPFPSLWTHYITASLHVTVINDWFWDVEEMCCKYYTNSGISQHVTAHLVRCQVECKISSTVMVSDATNQVHSHQFYSCCSSVVLLEMVRRIAGSINSTVSICGVSDGTVLFFSWL